MKAAETGKATTVALPAVGVEILLMPLEEALVLTIT